MADEPILWHIEVSHYNEKVRWALDYKGVAHERRAPLPGLHMAIALWLTRGRHATFPILKLDRRRIGNSTRIIESLEARYPEPPLYPVDPPARARALELEDFIDEEVAPHVRLLAQAEVIKDRESFDRYVARTGPLGGRGARMAGAGSAAFMKLRYRLDKPGATELAKRKIEAGLDRIEAELDNGDYLVGETFSIADLTGAAILYGIARPPEGPQELPPYPEPLRAYCDSLKERPAMQWVADVQASARQVGGDAFHRRRRRPILGIALPVSRAAGVPAPLGRALGRFGRCGSASQPSWHAACCSRQRSLPSGKPSSTGARGPRRAAR